MDDCKVSDVKAYCFYHQSSVNKVICNSLNWGLLYGVLGCTHKDFHASQRYIVINEYILEHERQHPEVS